MSHTLTMMISQEEIAQRVQAIAIEINEHYKNSEAVILIGLLRGSAIFLADLSRLLTVPVILDFMATSSYGKGTDGGEVKILKELDEEIHGKDVLIVEDIVDTGNTLNKIKKMLLLRDPKSLAICTLLNKPARRQAEVVIDWQGFSIEDKFVVGYGMDYAQLYRNLPYVGIVNFD
ncbi:hypoxanthine phosphoribosyltransferase [Psychromonas antarctica]|jgi:hypoxanthine phosphoribosyltransferase|uniref:hypoxanthine phosphoribosyltransferase n=1 Tax=Psychromonas antarctica TaxID=67573 RepID=UPI001EE8BFCF|nr:hypoxanthine phosphoribosyltransferase [Psychromonas antarctica]MCG6201039.1 hypoxanthine phosphoribosyltransferase [Psychromonas antarctica]